MCELSVYSDQCEIARETTILLVEDNAVMREVLRELLELLHPDWHVLEAENGLQGIEVAERIRPDVIVLDFNMPVMNGYEMALSLQERPETSCIPLVLNSSEDSANPLVMRLRAMCSAVLNKPFSLGDIEHLFGNQFPQIRGHRQEFVPAFHTFPA
ncbi:MAG TPA: response regulator [Caldilineaceae bacterium]|nr:response regulator [Caldilineaceae bacterium]